MHADSRRRILWQFSNTPNLSCVSRRPSQGLKEARLLLSEARNTSDEFIFLAHCLIAQAKLDMKDTAGAATELVSFSNDAADYSRGENVTYMYVVKSRILSAQKIMPPPKSLL